MWSISWHINCPLATVISVIWLHCQRQQASASLQRASTSTPTLARTWLRAPLCTCLLSGVRASQCASPRAHPPLHMHYFFWLEARYPQSPWIQWLWLRDTVARHLHVKDMGKVEESFALLWQQASPGKQMSAAMMKTKCPCIRQACNDRTNRVCQW